MWTTERNAVAGGERIELLEDGRTISFGRFFQLLAADDVFAAWYAKVLAASDYRAFYWEHPPLVARTVNRPSEFVLLDGPELASVEPDHRPFAERFEGQSDEVLTFPNLGGDALLVAPRPIGPGAAYGHLAAFVRHAPATQVREFWRVTAAAVHERLSAIPLWLSTAGMGVFWLHARLDSRPKYYRHRPYRDADFFDRL